MYVLDLETMKKLECKYKIVHQCISLVGYG